MGFKGGLEGLDRLEDRCPIARKAGGAPPQDLPLLPLHQPFEGSAGQATHKRDVLREVDFMSKIFPSPFGYRYADLIMCLLKTSWRSRLQYPINPA